MAIEHPPVAVPPAPAHSTGPERALSSDERWAAWVAKGAAHDRAVRRKLSLAAPILIVVAAAIIYALLRG
jgi:hypothetical protein